MSRPTAPTVAALPADHANRRKPTRMYVTREQWGARPARGTLVPYRPSPTIGVIHYIGEGLLGNADGKQRMRSIQQEALAGIHGDHYVDFPYNEAVDQHGTQYEGRGVQWQNGANSGAANRTMYAILALIGDEDIPTPQLEAGIIDLARQRGLTRLVPHSAVAVHPTACCGDRLRAWLATSPLEEAPPAPPDFSALVRLLQQQHALWEAA